MASTKSPYPLVIPRRSHQCSAGQEPLLPGTAYFSVVNEDAQGEYVRTDYCPNCWKTVERTEEAIHWKGKVPDKKKRLEYADLSRDERAMAVFKDTLSSAEKEHHEEAFVLSLFLARKRYLLPRKQLRKEETLFQLYEVGSTEEMVAVPQIDLSDLEVEKVQKRLAEKMQA